MTIRPSRSSALAATVMIAGLLAQLAPAGAQGNCEWYARTALQQQQENEQRKCGFVGPAWNSDFKAHLNWCASQMPDVTRAEAQRRAQELLGNCPAKR